MYPIDCFDVLDSSKMEAVRYYIDLNKKFLKETSKEEYELFIDFLKGNGKDIMQLMDKATTNKEFVSLFNKIEKELPYTKELSRAKTFETKIAFLHKAIAKQRLCSDVNLVGANNVLKKQRQIASDYDALIGVVGEYRDAHVSYQEMKEQLQDSKIITHVYSKQSNMCLTDIAEAIKCAFEKRNGALKEKRAKAFDKISDYFIKEQIHVLEQERVAEIEK